MAQSEAGDLYVGLQGSYVTYDYKDFTAGIRGAYHFSPLFQLNLSFNTNPWIKYEEENNVKYDAQLYTVDLDALFYIINNKSWGMAPEIGLAYFYGKEEKTSGGGIYDGGSESLFGLNLGWNVHYNINENWRANLFWKYSIFKSDVSFNTFGLGIGYYFNIF